MKKLMLASLLLVSSLLAGCELNNDNMKSVIEACKADKECMEIINHEINQALEERGIVTWEEHFYDEMSDEEVAMWNVLEELDAEYYQALEEMTEEDWMDFYYDDYFTIVREMTDFEKEAEAVIEELYDSIDWSQDLDEEFDTELENALGRELSENEKDALEVVMKYYEEIDSVYENMTEADFIELEHNITLTEEEKAAINLVDELYISINWNEDDEYETESEIEFLEVALNRELSEDEKVAIDLVEDLYTEIDEMYEYDIIAEYEYFLGRPLTKTEKEAIEYFLIKDETISW